MNSVLESKVTGILLVSRSLSYALPSDTLNPVSWFEFFFFWSRITSGVQLSITWHHTNRNFYGVTARYLKWETCTGPGCGISCVVVCLFNKRKREDFQRGYIFQSEESVPCGRPFSYFTSRSSGKTRDFRKQPTIASLLLELKQFIAFRRILTPLYHCSNAIHPELEKREE